MNVLPVVKCSDSDATGYDPSSEFETDTVSGSTQISLFEPIFTSLFESPAEQPVQRPPPKSYNPIGDDDPYLLIPPKVDGSLFETSTPQASPKWRTLRSTHASTSGTVLLQYPDAWKGTISAKTVSGDISVLGKGVKTIRDEKGWATKELVAIRGVDREGEGSTVNMYTTAGGVNFAVGSTGR